MAVSARAGSGKRKKSSDEAEGGGQEYCLSAKRNIVASIQKGSAAGAVGCEFG
jgi:hypothetical protein